MTATDAARATSILNPRVVVGLHTDDWEHFTESRDDLESAFAGTGLLVGTPRGERVEL